MDFNKITAELGRFGPALQNLDKKIKDNTTDVKIKIGYPVMLCGIEHNYFLVGDGQASLHPATKDIWVVTQKDIEELFFYFCGYAVYSHTDELRHGFISVSRRLRVGVTGTAVINNGVFQTVRDITSLSVRIPRDIYGCAKTLCSSGIQLKRGLLLAGPPSSGKTTLLRDLARELGAKNRTVVLDERFELHSGEYDLGIFTDVLEGYPKGKAFSHAIRCLSPEFILCDEVDDADIPAIHSALFSGVSIIATVHAGGKEELLGRALCRNLMQSGAFAYIALLKGRSAPTEIREIYEVEKLLENDIGVVPDNLLLSSRGYRIC